MYNRSHPALLQLIEIAKQIKTDQEGITFIDGEREKRIIIYPNSFTSNGTKPTCIFIRDEDEGSPISYETTYIEIRIPQNIDRVIVQILGYRYREDEPENVAHRDDKLYEIWYEAGRNDMIAQNTVSYKDDRFAPTFRGDEAISYVDGVCRSAVDSLKQYLANRELHPETQTGVMMA